MPYCPHLRHHGEYDFSCEATGEDPLEYCVTLKDDKQPWTSCHAYKEAEASEVT
jgi:hypothetical protein